MAGITGNPKRLLISRKDAITVSAATMEPDIQAAFQATKDSFSQVERALNSRVMSAKVKRGPTITLTALGTPILLPFPAPPAAWDPGTMVDFANNQIVTTEPGIYLVTAVIFVTSNAAAGGLYTGFVTSYAPPSATQVDQDLGVFSTPNIFQGSITIPSQLSTSYNYTIKTTVQRTLGNAADTAFLNSLAVTKIADVPSRFGI
jgi:hypothetical protein